MKKEDFALLMDSIVAFSTVITLIVIWKTLVEMKVQRKKLYEPEIFPLSFDFYYLHDRDANRGGFISAIATDERELANKKDKGFLTLKNLGQGVAKAISLEIITDIDYKNYFDLMIYELNDADLKIDGSGDSCFFMFYYKNEHTKTLSFPCEKTTTRNFDYLLPVKDTEEKLRIELPTALIFMLELSVLLMEKKSDLGHIDMKLFERLKDYFNLKFRINYEDNFGKKYSGDFEFSLLNLNVHAGNHIKGHLYKMSTQRIAVA